MKTDHVAQLVAAADARRPAALVTDLDTHAQAVFEESDPALRLRLSIAQAKAVRDTLRHGKSAEVTVDGRRLFVQARVPAPRLLVVGAVHITQALAPMAGLAGYEVVVIDPRRAFATAERFPGLSLRHDWPDEALDEIGLDARSAVVTLTHDPKLDDPALDRALRSEAFYIGALGSKKTHASRLQRLSALGHEEVAFVRIHGPAGLDLGGRSPAEIAVSVLAQMTAARHGKATR